MKNMISEQLEASMSHLGDIICVNDFVNGVDWSHPKIARLRKDRPVIRAMFTVDGKIAAVAAFEYRGDSEVFYNDRSYTDELISGLWVLFIEDVTLWGQQCETDIQSIVAKAHFDKKLRIDFTHDACVSRDGKQFSIDT